MFSRKNRLKRQEIGDNLKNPDFSFKTNNFSLKGSKNNLDFNRFCVVVPKKQTKSAVKRHFIKRRIFNILKNKNILEGVDLVFLVKNDIFYIEKEEINEELDILLKKCIIDNTL